MGSEAVPATRALWLAALWLAGAGCSADGSIGASSRPHAGTVAVGEESAAAPTTADWFPPSCPGGIPSQLTDDVEIAVERDGARAVLVTDTRSCEPDPLATMSPPFGWSFPAATCVHVPRDRRRASFEALVQRSIERIRVHAPSAERSALAVELRWRGSRACRVGGVARLTQVHPDDRDAFLAAVAAVASVVDSVETP